MFINKPVFSNWKLNAPAFSSLQYNFFVSTRENISNYRTTTQRNTFPDRSLTATAIP